MARPLSQPHAIDAAARHLARFCGAALPLVVLLALPGAGAAGTAHAQDVLPDPTRPPAAMLPAATGAPAVAEDALRLQSVIISEGRRGAIIGGEYVALGGRVGDARLTRVEPSGVVLRGPGGEVALPLFPAARKLPVQAQPEGAKAGAPAQTARPRTHPTPLQGPVPRQEKLQ
jgi:MSHA biogenesis protein MshK